jgi:hypothetical protein
MTLLWVQYFGAVVADSCFAADRGQLPPTDEHMGDTASKGLHFERYTYLTLSSRCCVLPVCRRIFLPVGGASGCRAGDSQAAARAQVSHRWRRR